MKALMLLKEGAPFSYAVVLLALFAMLCAVVQLVKRDRDLSSLVLGSLTALLALCGAGIAHGISILTATGGADPATKATFIARAVSSAIAVSCSYSPSRRSVPRR